MSAKLKLWEPCLDCASRKIVENTEFKYDKFNNSKTVRYESCASVPVCKYIDGLRPLGEGSDAS